MDSNVPVSSFSSSQLPWHAREVKNEKKSLHCALFSLLTLGVLHPSTAHCSILEPGTPESRSRQGKAACPMCLWRSCITQRVPRCFCHHPTQEHPAPCPRPVISICKCLLHSVSNTQASGQPSHIKGSFTSVLWLNSCPEVSTGPCQMCPE